VSDSLEWSALLVQDVRERSVDDKAVVK